MIQQRRTVSGGTHRRTSVVLSRESLADVDRLVAAGHFASRSAAVDRALVLLRAMLADEIAAAREDAEVAA